MELRDFIAQSLVGIVEGVEKANAKTKRFKLASDIHASAGSGQNVEFDVAVTVSHDSQGAVAGKINVVYAKVDADLQQNRATENVNRMKFKVFITESEIV